MGFEGFFSSYKHDVGMLVLEFHFSHLSYPGKVSGRLDRKEIEGLMISRNGLLIHDLSIYSNR